MTTLIACLSSGKGTWAEVNNIIKSENWEKIYLVCSEFAYENYKTDQNKITKLKLDEKDMQKSFNVLSNFFKKEIKDFEVALNLTSGTGIEHMAILSSILKAGLGLRFIYFDKNEVNEFKILEGSFENEEDLI